MIEIIPEQNIRDHNLDQISNSSHQSSSQSQNTYKTTQFHDKSPSNNTDKTSPVTDHPQGIISFI